MQRVARTLLPVVLLAALGTGCAYMQRQKAKQVEPLLSAAGFKMKVADTPEKLAKLKAVPQLKLKPLTRHGTLYYGYADADGCGCAYLGDETAYQNYQGLVQEQQFAREDREAADVDQDAAIIEDEGMWDSWGGEW